MTVLELVSREKINSVMNWKRYTNCISDIEDMIDKLEDFSYIKLNDFEVLVKPNKRMGKDNVIKVMENELLQTFGRGTNSSVFRILKTKKGVVIRQRLAKI